MEERMNKAIPVQAGTSLMALCQRLHEVLVSNTNSLRVAAEFAADRSIANNQKFLVYAIHSLDPLSFSWFRQTAESHAEAQKVCRETVEEQGNKCLMVLSSRPEMINLTL
jgi:hypothetical protein